MKFCTRVRLKPSNDRGEFELDRTKNNFAENLFALGHEMHNTYIVTITRVYSRGHMAHPRQKVEQWWLGQGL